MPDPETGEAISDAEVAEIPEYTAFGSRKTSERVTARLIVRRVRDLAKPPVVGEQRELSPIWRYHPLLTDQPAPTLQAEREHRHHAVVEQVITDSKAGALAHLPSGHFHANAAWLTLWTMTYNLLRAAGALTSSFHSKATTATLRTHLIQPGRFIRPRPTSKSKTRAHGSSTQAYTCRTGSQGTDRFSPDQQRHGRYLRPRDACGADAVINGGTGSTRCRDVELAGPSAVLSPVRLRRNLPPTPAAVDAAFWAVG